MTIPNDYLERVYAGVLGKLIGVYLGRPFEGWTHERIIRELGPIDYYVHDRLGDPLVVTDDDVSGTFTFIRALEDYGISEDLSAADIGRAWLNYIIEERAILWWGGNGNSTEHTAWLNLKKGIPAPQSGSIAQNGKAVAEQIGAQIFIDGWAMVAPGRPELAARLAEQAGKVSHDGESVYAAKLWAAMESEAFHSKDINHLIDTGLSQIPGDCLIAQVIADVRAWHRMHANWRDARARIAETYGYDKFPGNCHVVPNHAIMIMTMLYAPDDFQKAQLIVNTCGWDTDCNAGNVGCLMGLMHGLEGLEAGPDWRGPLADRMLISTADGGNSVNDAVRMAYYITSLGYALAGKTPLSPPKNGARFHFSLPGSAQGFRPLVGFDANAGTDITNVATEDGRALAVRYAALAPGQKATATTPVFSSPELLKMRTYDLMATPLAYPGQTVRARVMAPSENAGTVTVALMMRHYDGNDRLVAVEAPSHVLAAGKETILEWRLPATDGQPIGELGLVVRADGRRADGTVLVDYLRIDGTPDMLLQRPAGDGDFWRKAWVNGVSFFSRNFPASFRISQSEGEGLIAHGTRDWSDYTAETEILIHLGNHAGLALRVQGLRRYYAVRVTRAGKIEIVKIRDETVTVLAEQDYDFAFERPIAIAAKVEGRTISAVVDGIAIKASDDSAEAFADGGIGLVIHEGAVSADKVSVRPV
ncbi:ADP-ribosylglycohydrolase family protein [uncultured Martelella sp.]|uniref:ADP-ribosylglycohydrolase family protein n=1 Tax=uncultured Martelella sp. TaxID=392331 RepID=UPI0029C80E00|nr:ADP-ribosylglycohydrolase family protein [uncultured Martelella sp.]